MLWTISRVCNVLRQPISSPRANSPFHPAVSFACSAWKLFRSNSPWRDEVHIFDWSEKADVRSPSRAKRLRVSLTLLREQRACGGST